MTTTVQPETHDAVRWHARVGPILETAPVVRDGTVYANGGRLVALDASDGSERWTHSARSDWNASHARPMVADGRVYAALGAPGDGDSVVVVAVDGSDGRERWRFEPPAFDGPVLSAGATADAVYFGSAGGTEAGKDFYAVGVGGEQRWHRNLAGTCTGSAAVADGAVVVETDDGLHALDPTTGEMRWRTDHGVPGCTPVVDGGAVYVDREGLTALDAQDGSVRWELDEDLPDASELALVDGRLYAVGAGVVYGLNPSTGAVTWRASLPPGRLYAATVHDDQLYVGIDGHVSAFDAATGERAWQVERDADHVAVGDGTAFVTADSWRSLSALDAADGTRRWHVAFEHRIVAPPVVASGTAYVSTDERTVYALS